MKKLDRVWLWAVLAVVWMGVIYALSDRPAGDFDDANDAVSSLPFASTVVHVGLYFVLSVFVLCTLVLLRPVSPRTDCVFDDLRCSRLRRAGRNSPVECRRQGI
jgi:hypothetical protein